MKTKLLLCALILGAVIRLQAQEVPKLIVSEIYMYHTEEAYVELTNMGTEAVDLSRVIFAAAQNNESYRTDTSRWNVQFLTGGGMLDPGESFVVMNYRTATLDPTNIFTPNWYFKHADYLLQYTLRASSSGMRFTNGNDAFGLFWDRDGDYNLDFALDTLIDEVGVEGGNAPFSVAGVTNASITHAFIRKASVTKGNAGDWSSSAGLSAEDSEWIVVPYDPYSLGELFTTVGNHGNTFSWDFNPVSGTIDGDNNLSMAWGAWRDSIFKDITVGGNMAWHLKWGPDTLESNAVQTADTLLVYLCGDEVETRKYPITVTEALESNNKIIPKLDRTGAGNLFSPFLVTDGVPVIDTIYSIPYSTRADSLLIYLEKASNASWVIQTFDGATRAEIKTGDKLIVTAANGDIKEYYLLTDEYSPSDNAYLQTILINNDTLWGFSRNLTSYNLILPNDAQAFPSISATTENNDARATITHPSFIRGTEAERTAIIKVIAESDTIINNYYIVFDVARSTQKNVLEPFISQVVSGNNSGESAFEIFNPSNTVISLADFMFVRARPDNASFPVASLEDAISPADSADWNFLLNFGFYHDNSRSGEGIFFKEATSYDIDIEPYSVWFMKRGNTNHWGGPNNADFYCLKNDQDDVYGSNDGAQVGYWFNGYNHWLLRMENDSIISGLKSGDDPDDWKFVDIWGTVDDRFDHTRTIDGWPLEYTVDQHMIRKGNISKGNTSPYGSIDEGGVPGSSEWFIVNGEDYTGPLNDVGRHSGFIKPTNFKSTISSVVYLVSNGIGNNESIKGIFPGSTVSAMLEKVIKADPEQTLTVIADDGSGEIDISGAVATGDTLIVLSKDMLNTTRYVIETGFLSNNALLSSSTYTISVSGVEGTISTVEHFTTIGQLLDQLTVPDKAFMNIFDNNRQHVPLLHLTPDTLLVIDPIVSDIIFIEVIAQDGVTRIVYSLVMAEFSEPYLTSNIYLVDQEEKVIDLFVDNTNILTFLNHVTPSSGAVISVYDKLDYERSDGNMFIDDKIVVTDQNEASTIYTLHGFMDREVVVDTTDTTSRRDILAPGFNEHSIYPNPATSSVKVDGLEPGSKVAVINLFGEIVEIREAYENKMELNLNAYATGIYFIRIMKDQHSFTYKFIKQ